MNMVEELKWRGMLQDITPGAAEALDKGSITVYAGFDPTAASLQLGNLVPIMLLMHFQKAGHKPLALVGGATGMIGDPSGKSEERVLLSMDIVESNVENIRRQLGKFLDFNCGSTSAELVNNNDWFKNILFLDFLRDAGKHLTVSYMIAKDSVKTRMDAGISFTEFSYQLLQAYDFWHLFTQKNCTFQVGGSDQWGNITSGTELIRRKAAGEAFALTCPLVTKADGTKFGKSEGGQKIWLDSKLTSVYKFYQFWLNQSDADAKRFIRIFTLMSKEEILAIEHEHAAAPHLRALQKSLARDVTSRIHSPQECQKAIDASEILFGEGTTDRLATLGEDDLLSAFEGVPAFSILRSELDAGIALLDLVSVKTTVFPSKGEAKRMIPTGGVSINKVKMTDGTLCIKSDMLLGGKYLLVQKGKKNYNLVKCE